MKKEITVFILVLFSSSLLGQGKITCFLSGQTFERPQNEIVLLTPYNTDSRVKDPIVIEIVNNRFEYELVCNEEELYELVFQSDLYNGSWNPTYFMSENGTVTFELYPLERSFYNDVFEGTGILNKELKAYLKQDEELFHLKTLSKQIAELPLEGLSPEVYDIKQQISVLREKYGDNTSDEKYLVQMDSLNSEIDLIKDNAYTDEYKKLAEEYRNNYSASIKWEVDYLLENTTLVGLCQTFRLLRLYKQYEKYGMFEYAASKEKLTNAFNDIYKVKYPNHPVTRKIEFLLEADKVKAGSRYVDFTCPDFNGVSHTLSKEIEGKMALIDLWASWCGPCRRRSMELIPVYNDFKEKGFTVVGVARENKIEDGKNALEKDGYRWLNLLELKDENNIWAKYGIGNAGGAQFLVDKDGYILKIDPSAEEVREILNEKLK